MHGERTRRPLGQDDDGVLLGRVAGRDRAAFEALYLRYAGPVSRFLFKLLRRPELVEEVLNDVMLVVWRRAATFAGRSRPSTWIMGIAYRRALKALGADLRREEGAGVDLERLAQTTADVDRAVSGELALSVREALAALPPKQRAVVELTYDYGCSYQEIAEIAGCPVNTVKTRMFHARRRLRATLEKGETEANPIRPGEGAP